MQRSSLLFPALTRLNLAQNKLLSIPTIIGLLEQLGTLILRDNRQLKEVNEFCFFSFNFDRNIFLFLLIFKDSLVDWFDAEIVELGPTRLWTHE